MIVDLIFHKHFIGACCLAVMMMMLAVIHSAWCMGYSSIPSTIKLLGWIGAWDTCSSAGSD